MKEKDSNEKDENKKLENSKSSESFLKQKELEDNLKKKTEYNKQVFNYQQNKYLEDINMKHFRAQRHLYDHKKEKKNSLVNITQKFLQTEYIEEVHYIFKRLIFSIVLSILIFIQSLLIFHNYKNYTEVILSQIFSAFTFFTSFFLIVEIYRDALRDILRSYLFRLFSIFLTIFIFCLYVSQSMNTYIIYKKIKIRKVKCENDKKYCGDTFVNNLILVLSSIHIIGFIIIFYFSIWMGYRAFRILFGCDYEVYQKQIFENDKNKKKTDKKENNNDKENASKNIKEHLKID